MKPNIYIRMYLNHFAGEHIAHFHPTINWAITWKKELYLSLQVFCTKVLLFLRLQLETGPPFYVVIRATRRSSSLRSRRQRGRDACYKNPLLFISADAGVRKFLIGWAVMSNLLACILACISVTDKHDKGIKKMCSTSISFGRSKYSNHVATSR